MIKVGSDFSGVGAFNQALKRLGIEYKELFACDMDKYARSTFIHNYGEPEYYPTNVYERYIPAESLDIYMTSPPCQAFSLAGKRLGKNDKRGILFFNSLEFIKVNKPRYFIFENVKGLLSDDNGNTFAEWVALLGGKSVNGSPLIFSFEDSVPYHLYWSVLNAKDYGVPQNRERVFLIGIRDDRDNNFRFPKEERLTKSLKDVLEDDVDEKYFLSERMINYLESNSDKQKENGNGFKYNPTDGNKIANSITTKAGNRMDDDFIRIGTWRTHEDGRGFREIEDGNCPTIPARAREDGSGQPVIIHNCITEAIGRQGSSSEYIDSCKKVNQALEQKYNDKRLSKTVSNNKFTIGIPSAIDSFNQSVSELVAPTVKLPHNDRFMFDGYKIRRLTPRECFRLMDFPDTFTWTCSDSQAYKQAGNSIVVSVLAKIINNLKLS
jgi:DNA (cytosine-5)-methyltransferase 1